MRTIISVFKGRCPGSWDYSIKFGDGSREITNRAAGGSIGEAAAKATSLAIGHKPSIVVADSKIMDLIPSEFKDA